MANSYSNILITGSSSGLGRYLHETSPGSTGLCRQDKLDEVTKGKTYDAIIHCAFRRSQGIKNAELAKVLEDNFFLTEKLIQVPHKKFIYFSSNTVYPGDKNFILKEDIPIPLEDIETFPGVLKLMNEEMIRIRCKNHLIFRSTSLVGHTMKPNTLTRILFDPSPKISMTPTSRLNCILYEDIKKVLTKGIEENIKGIFNLASIDSVAVSDIASHFNKKIAFGNFQYDPGNIDTQKLRTHFPEMIKTTWQSIESFYKSETVKAG